MKKLLATAITVSLMLIGQQLVPLHSTADTKTYTLGDANSDGNVDVFDLCLIKQEAVSPGSKPIDLKAADINGDGVVDIKDAVEFQNFILTRENFFSAQYNGIYSGRNDYDLHYEMIGERSKIFYTVTSKEDATNDDSTPGEMYIIGAYLEPSDTDIEIPSYVSLHGNKYRVIGIYESAFEGQVNIRSVKNGGKLNVISRKAFKDCKSLTSFELDTKVDPSAKVQGASLDYIEASAFENCTSLTSLSTMSNTKHIGDCAFKGCKSLKTLNLYSTETLGKGTFSGTGIETAMLASSAVTKFPEDVFRKCDALTAVQVPFYLSEIGDNAFAGCQKLESVYGGMTTLDRVGAYAFDGCASLEDASALGGMREIGDYAFKDCTSLKTTAPYDTEKLGIGVYMNSGITECDLSETAVDEIPERCFEGCKSLTSITAKDHNTIKKIGDSAFRGCESFKDVNALKYASYFGDYAFYGCSTIENFYFYSSIDMLGKYAFAECGSLTGLTLVTTPRDTVIKEGTFRGCSKLIGCALLDYATEIGDYAFAECSSFVRKDFPEVTKIGNSAFRGCSSIKTINMGMSARKDTITEIDDYAFDDCAALEKIEFLTPVKIIGNHSFSGCRNIELLFFPEGLEEVGISAFANCSSLETIMLPETVREIGNFAFNYCEALKYFVVKNPDAVIGDYALGYNNFRNTNVTKTEDFVIWGNGGNIEKYAEDNEFTYKDIAIDGAVSTSDFPENIKPYVFSYTNVDNNWGIHGVGTAITYAYRDELEEFYGKKVYNETFGGICYGLAAFSTLASDGLIDISKVNEAVGRTGNTSILRQLPNLKSKYLLTAIWKRGTTDFNYDYINITNELLNYLEYMRYGATPAVMNIDPYSNKKQFPHAVVCYGIEYKNDSNKDDENWSNEKIKANARLLTYDNNTNEIDSARFVYVNTETGEWYYPYTNITSYSHAGTQIACLTFRFRPYHILKLNDKSEVEPYINKLLEAVSNLD